MTSTDGGRSSERSLRGMTPDEFIKEVIGIGRLESFNLDIDPTRGESQQVHATVALLLPDDTQTSFFDAGRTIGLALENVRKQIRMEVGR